MIQSLSWTTKNYHKTLSTPLNSKLKKIQKCGRHFVFRNRHTCSSVLDVENRLSEFEPLLCWEARVAQC